ncbi:MAG: hypothetical protein WAN51_03590 [Alphaproteobacteria bacterium]
MPLWRILFSMFLVFAMGMTLSACGKRGVLDTPDPHPADAYPRQYPKQDLPREAPTTQQTPGQVPPQAPAPQSPAQQPPVPEPMYQ